MAVPKRIWKFKNEKTQDQIDRISQFPNLIISDSIEKAKCLNYNISY